MKMICEVPDEVIKCIKDGTWCGSSVAEKMIANGIPLSSSEELCEDAISRQAVLDATVNKNSIWNKITNAKGENLEKIISQLPPVDPQPKTGYWIVQPSNEEQGERPFIWWKCSNCGHVIYSESTHDRLEFHAFCSRCGVKMVEPQEGGDQE